MSVDAELNLYMIVAGLAALALVIRSVVEFRARQYVRGAVALGAVGVWAFPSCIGLIWLALSHYCEGAGCGDAEVREETTVPVLGYTCVAFAVSAFALYPPYREWRRKRSQSRRD
jgi:hypothetical protein